MTMKPKETYYNVGVIIGRFQVPNLHEAHLELIKSIVDTHDKVIIFLGLSPCKTTTNNPLDFESRKQMILEKFPDVNVLYIKDEMSDEVWSKKLDNQIKDLVGPNQTVALYGSRESFLPFYKGKYPTIELEPMRYVNSGTDIRRDVSNKVKASPDFRAGVIWAVNNQFPSVYPTVDIAIIDWDKNRILLGRKPNEDKYRFPGGFAMPDSECYEDDAKRETMEETGLEVGDLTYVGSMKVNDWRYKKEVNKIKTLLFTAKYIFGCPKAGDDLSEVRWFDLNTLTDDVFVPNHKMLFAKVGQWINKITNEKFNF